MFIKWLTLAYLRPPDTSSKDRTSSSGITSLIGQRRNSNSLLDCCIVSLLSLSLAIEQSSNGAMSVSPSSIGYPFLRRRRRRIGSKVSPVTQLPSTCNFARGLVVPMPTLPVPLIAMTGAVEALVPPNQTLEFVPSKYPNNHCLPLY